MEIQVTIILVLAFFLMFAMSVPVLFSTISASLLTIIMFLTPGPGTFVSAQKIVSGIDNFTLLAAPFFVLVGLLMSNGGIVERLTNLVMLFLGKVPDSLVMTSTTDDVMFSFISGSGTAAATAIGDVMPPLGEERGYDKSSPAVVNITTVPMGQLIPPTVSLIVHPAASDDVSVAALLMANWVSGLLWATLCMAVACIYGAKHGCMIRRNKMNVAVIIKTIWEVIPSLSFIVIIVGGILSGYLTPIEVSGVAVVHTFPLLVLVYKSIQIKDIPKILVDTVVMTAIIMPIIGASPVLFFIPSFTRLPQVISSLLLGTSDNRIIIPLITSITLLIVGTFMDMAPALPIFTPIFLPVVKNLGMNPVQPDVMTVMSLSIGTTTPPVRSVLFMGRSVAKLQVEDVMKRLLPLFVTIVAALMFITFALGFNMWLPGILRLLKQEGKKSE